MSDEGESTDDSLNSLVFNQHVINSIMADALGLSHDQMQGVYEVGNGNIKVLFTGDSDD